MRTPTNPPTNPFLQSASEALEEVIEGAIVGQAMASTDPRVVRAREAIKALPPELTTWLAGSVMAGLTNKFVRDPKLAMAAQLGRESLMGAIRRIILESRQGNEAGLDNEIVNMGQTARRTAERVTQMSFIASANPRVLAAIAGTLAAAHEEVAFDNPAAYANSPARGGHSQYQGVCGQAHQLAHVIPWAMKNAPADLSAIMETTAAVTDTQTLPHTGAVYESVRQWPRYYVGQAIPLLLELDRDWMAKFQDWRDLMLDTDAAGDRARGWWGWVKANWIPIAVVIALISSLLLLVGSLLPVFIFGGMAVGGSIITYALHPVIFLEPLKYPWFFLGVIFWAASVALTMPTATEVMMKLSGKSEDPEPPGTLTRWMAMGLQRLGFNTQFMLAMPRTATRIRGLRKLAKRLNVIVMAVSVLAILVDIVATPVSITWMTVRALFILGIFIWLFVDYVGFNEKALNEGQKFTDKMAQSSVKFILTPAILGLAVVILFVGMPLSIAEQVAHWAWDESADVREDAAETASGWFDDDSSKDKANPDVESDAAKEIERLKRKHGK